MKHHKAKMYPQYLDHAVFLDSYRTPLSRHPGTFLSNFTAWKHPQKQLIQGVILVHLRKTYI